MRPFIADIILYTAEEFGLTVDDIKGKSRVRHLVRARQVACFLAREMTGHSYPHIGGIMGGRDHSTIIHACRLVPELTKRDARFAETIDFIRKRVTEATEVLKSQPRISPEQEMAEAVRKCEALEAKRKAQRDLARAKEEADRIRCETELLYVEIEVRRAEKERLLEEMTEDALMDHLVGQYVSKPLRERMAA